MIRGSMKLLSNINKDITYNVDGKDITGAEIHRTLCVAVSQEPQVKILEEHIAINLKIRAGQCLGAYVLDYKI